MTTYTIRVKLNDSDPIDAAILEILRGCTKGRMSSFVRETLAAALGLLPGRPAQAQWQIEKPERLERAKPNPANILPFESGKPAPPVDEKSALDHATSNFLDAFGGLAK